MKTETEWGWVKLEVESRRIRPGEHLRFRWSAMNTSHRDVHIKRLMVLVTDMGDNPIATLVDTSALLYPGTLIEEPYQDFDLCDDPPQIPWNTKIYIWASWIYYGEGGLPEFFIVGPIGLTCTGEGCYIATAVYGSYDHPVVMRLRAFRDRHLPKPVVKGYYAVSPKMVRSRFFNRLAPTIRKIIDMLLKEN